MSLQKRNFIALNIVENVVGHKKVIYILYDIILKNDMSIKHQKKRDNTFGTKFECEKEEGKIENTERGEERHTGCVNSCLRTSL